MMLLHNAIKVRSFSPSCQQFKMNVSDFSHHTLNLVFSLWSDKRYKQQQVKMSKDKNLSAFIGVFCNNNVNNTSNMMVFDTTQKLQERRGGGFDTSVE